nr:Pseudouridine synthase domain containing protein [Haemonchus contortus]
MEQDFGLSNYIGDRKVSVPCVLKELYSDFIVQEVLDDRSVLQLRTADDIKNYVKEEEERGVDETVTVPSFLNSEQLASLDALNKSSKPLLISCEGFSKDDRKALHEFVRMRYHGKLNTETKENSIEVSYFGIDSRSRKRKRWHKDCPNQGHFTLAKENKDTSYALGVIAKFLNVNTNTFRTHGIKDRRAITCQRVSCNRIEKERILSLNSRLRDIIVYDFEYENDELKMGGHWGNRFSIVLRSIPPELQSTLTGRLEELENKGFINYFGMQRFGSCGTSTAEVGKRILKRDWEGAVALVLNNDHLPGYLGSVGDALRCWKQTKDASQALRYLKGSQAYASIEAIIFKCLARGGTWQKCITEALPMNLRSLYVHAYQSLLWNKVVSRRITENGTTVQADDVGQDGKKLPSEASPFDIYIPLPGEASNFEKNYVSRWYEEMLTADDLSMSSFSTLEDRFALGETARPMLIRPVDVKWRFIRYSDPRAHLQFSLPSGCYATVALRQITGTDMGKNSMKIHAEAAKTDWSNAQNSEHIIVSDLVKNNECHSEGVPVETNSTDGTVTTGDGL